MSRSRFTRRALAFGAAVVLSAGLAACAAPEADPETPQEPGLATYTEGKLTIATGQPAYPPYVLNDAPESGEGFEAAVAYAVAEELGFAKEDVVWVRATWDETIAPGVKPYDFNLQQVSITEERRQFVDFAGPYFALPQTVVTIGSSPAAGATTLAELKDVRIGVAAGTTSLTAVENVIEPNVDPLVFNNNDDAKLALENGQVDAIVVDLWTAFYIASAELTDGQVVGQLAGTDDDAWGLVLTKDNPLTADVQAAVDRLVANGALEALAEQWLAGDSGTAVLR